MTVQIKIQFNNKYLTIPINPEELNIQRSADNDDLDIVGLGKVTRKGVPSLMSCSIESFFPCSNSYFYTGVTPKTCVDFINEIWNTENKNNNVAKISTTGLPKNLNMYFVIEEFEYDYKAGEEEDIYYTLKIKEYIPYGVRVVKTNISGTSSYNSSQPRASSSNPSQNTSRKTYKVVKGDCLWNITKKFTGAGSRWRELYNLNKSVIGSNPNLIYPNQLLTLPTGW